MVTDTLQLPTDRDTAMAMLNDPAEIKKWLEARRFTDLQDRYNELTAPPLAEQVANILDAREAANGSIQNATKAAMDEWLAQHGMQGPLNRPAMGAESDKPVVVRNEVAKKIQDIGFTNLGDFAREIWHKNPIQNRPRYAEISKIMDAFSSVEGATGGALIPESFDSEIRSLTLEQTIVRSRATIVPMTTPTQLFPFVDWTTNSGSTFGGWTVTRVQEGGAIVPSQARFGRARLSVTKQVAGAEVPNEMFSDVAALDGFIRSTLPQAMAHAEDIDFLVGDGAGGPLGALHSTNTALITVTKETGQAASSVLTDNVLKMYARMLPSSKMRAAWIVNPTTFVQLQQLSLPVGTGGAPVMLVNFANSPVPTMLGRPIVETEKVPALGSASDISFIDFSYYLIGDRPGSGLESSPHSQFMNDITEMKLTARNDGRPWIVSPLTPVNGDTLSPFVTLGARA